MTPNDLFAAYQAKAERLAERLCWHFQVSGAMQWVKEAKSEATMALWKESVRFNSRKQKFERLKDMRAISHVYWSILHKRGIPVCDPHDPYKTFWMFAYQRVSGAVIDYFRSMKLITRLSRTEEKVAVVCERCGATLEGVMSQECALGGFCRAPRSMLYHERFLSASGILDIDADNDHNQRSTFLDLFPSTDRSDSSDGLNHARHEIVAKARISGLSIQELRIVVMMCGEDGADREDVAQRLHMTSAQVSKSLKSATGKMQMSA